MSCCGSVAWISKWTTRLAMAVSFRARLGTTTSMAALAVGLPLLDRLTVCVGLGDHGRLVTGPAAEQARDAPGSLGVVLGCPVMERLFDHLGPTSVLVPMRQLVLGRLQPRQVHGSSLPTSL